MSKQAVRGLLDLGARATPRWRSPRTTLADIERLRRRLVVIDHGRVPAPPDLPGVSV